MHKKAELPFRDVNDVTIGNSAFFFNQDGIFMSTKRKF